MRSQLRDFKIVDLEVSPENIQRGESVANSIVFRNQKTGKPTILLASFPNGTSSFDRSSPAFKKNVGTLRSLGFDVIPVPDSLSKAMTYGGLHCLTNRY